jgi:hypothetical protein
VEPAGPHVVESNRNLSHLHVIATTARIKILQALHEVWAQPTKGNE